jgi:hypothetical protein
MSKAIFTVLGGFLALNILPGCGGGGGEGTFTTSVPGDRPLGGLTPGELITFCADGQKFSAQPTVKQDRCRLAAFLGAADVATFSPTATDADLKMACSQVYDNCSSSTPNCPHPPATCTATVAELTTCATATAAQTHDLAGKLPDCGAIDRASINASANVLGTVMDRPASCQPLDMKCSGSSSGDGGSVGAAGGAGAGG